LTFRLITYGTGSLAFKTSISGRGGHRKKRSNVKNKDLTPSRCAVARLNMG
jgi:hypothetical protein